MAYQFQINHETKFIYKKVWADYDDEQARRSHDEWQKFSAEEDIRDYNEILDLSEVTSYTVSVAMIREVAQAYEYLFEGSGSAVRIGYVVPSALVFGSGRVFDAMISSTGVQFSIFKSLSDALDWLDLPDFPFEQPAKKLA